MKTFLFPASLLLLLSQTTYALTIQPLPSIQDAVGAYVNANLEAGGRHQVEMQPLDPRLQLPFCETPLQTFSQSGDIKAGRNTIGVRCDGEKSWTIYSLVAIKTFKEVLVLAKPLRRNDKIRAEDLAVEIRDIGTLQQGYISDPNDVLNKQSTRNLPAGSVLNKLCYQELTVVKRGEHVNIQSGSAGFLISAPGTAMMDGAKGERINVRNTASQRVIQAVVVDAGVVSVYF